MENMKEKKWRYLGILLLMLMFSLNLTVHAEAQTSQNLTIVFMDQTGKVYTELQMQQKIGDTITLPMVPGRENAIGSSWKLDLSVADSEATRWEAGSELTLTLGNLYLAGMIKENVLTFYAIPGQDPCVVTFYNNGGTGYFKTMQVAPGTQIVLPDFVRDNWKNLGWTLTIGSSIVEYKAGDTYTITQNTNFYIVRYAVSTASFRKNGGGTNNIYAGLEKTIKKGDAITLPSLPTVTGYQALGWALSAKQTTANYKAGDIVSLNSNTTFYAVYKYVGKYTVKFNNNGGTSSSSKYTALNKTVTKSTYITLPSVPDYSGYVELGWTTTKKGTTAMYSAGDKVKVTKNMTFYAVYKKAYNVYLYSKAGKLLKKVEVEKNAYYTLPACMSKNGYTMMGWSTKKGQSVDPTYEVREKIKVTKNMKLYSVLYVHSKETNYSGLQLQNVTMGLTSKYKKVIFVGDSRTNRMNLSLKMSGYAPSSDNISFICQEGGDLSWLQETGYSQLLKTVGKSTLKSKSIAVVFNLGVNDLSNVSEYVTYMKSIAFELEKRGCKLYYMSVNPINSKNISYYGKKTRTETQVRSFNAKIKSGLCGSKGSYTYLDTYSYLLKYGFSTNGNNEGYDLEKDDGLHYSAATSKRIFRYCILKLLK